MPLNSPSTNVITANRPVSHYRLPLRTRDLPYPPRWTPREKAIAQQRLTQFVVLSMLLHTIAILLFGAPVGGSPEGRAMWGSLRVVIREAYRPTPAPAAPSPAPPAIAAPAPPAPMPNVEAPPAPAGTPSVEPEAVAPKPAEFPPMLDRLAPSEIKIEPAVDFKVAPVETPKIPAPLLQQMPAMPERAITLPKIEAPVIRVPVETPKIPAPLLQPMPTIQDRTTLPAIEAPVIRIPVETPKIPAPLLQPMPTIQDRNSLPPVERVPPPPPMETRTPPVETKAPPVETKAPPVETKAPPVETKAPPVETRTPPVETRPQLPQFTYPSAPADIPPGVTREQPSPFRAPPPERKEEYDPTKPALDLDAIRKRAGEIARQGTGNRAMLPIPMPPVEKPKSKLEQGIENARKPDCREAYKGLGLLAVVPLIANEFGEGTCKWRP